MADQSVTTIGYQSPNAGMSNDEFDCAVRLIKAAYAVASAAADMPAIRGKVRELRRAAHAFDNFGTSAC